MRECPKRPLLAVAVASAGLAACGGGSVAVENAGTTQSSMAGPTTASAPVQNHVHGAVLGPVPADILLGTHFGLRRSPDGGATWRTVAGTGGGMVAAIVRVPAGYAAAVMPMSAMGGSGAMSGGGSMGMGGRAKLMYSPDGQTWGMAVGLPDGASISNLASAPSGSVDWASVTGKGIYRSADAGRTWSLAVPTSTLITALVDTGPSLVVGTPDGLGITPSDHPAVPGAMSLSGAVNAVSRWWSCPTCLVATLGAGGVATSRDGGKTWQSVAGKQVFDNVASFASTGAVVFGMVASPTEPGPGVWRSADGGHAWTQVLTQPQVDYMFEVPGAQAHGGNLLAFQWGIVEWRSADGGLTWSQLAHL
jgi:hypothetical protein